MIKKSEIIQLKFIQQKLKNRYLITKMSLHCGFLFPKRDFKLIFMNTVGYISDNVFYRINLQTLQTEIFHHPQGRSYQAFTACAKRQLVVLVDYGKNPTFYFEYHDKQRSFEVRDICPLEVTKVELSLNGKYLAILCGTPNPQLVFYDIENRRLLEGSRSGVALADNYTEIKRIGFNPGNPRQVAIQFSSSIDIYQMKEYYELDGADNLQQGIMVKKVDTVKDKQIQTFIWDEINNLYISNKKQVYIYSTDTKARILSCDIEIDHDDEGPVVANILLTRKHVIVFYRTGRIEWLNKYYPESMEEQDVALRPFYLDKYYETSKEIRYSLYDGLMSKIFISFSEGCFGILPKAAENNQADEEEEQTGKKQNYKTTQKKVDVDLTLTPHYHANPIVLIHEFHNTAACVTLSSAGRFILWSIKGKRQLETHAIIGDITCASVNKQGNVLATGHSDGVVRFYSIAKPNDIFLFKEFRLVKNQQIDKVMFSTNGQELGVLSNSQNRIYYLLTSLSMEFEVLGYVELPFPVKNINWMGPTKSPIPPRYEYLLVCLGFGVLMVSSPPAVPTKKRGKDLDLKLDIYALKTDPNQSLVAGLPTGELLTTGKDKYIKKYKQPEELKIDWRSKTPPNPPLQQIDGHDFQIQLFQHSEHFFMSGGKQGKVQLRDYNNFKDINQLKAYGWKNNLMSCIAGSWNRGLVFTAGRDGSFYMWKVGEWQVKGEDKVELQMPNFKKIVSAQQQLKYYELVIEDQYRQRNKDKIEQKKKVQLQKLTKIRQQLKNLLQQNQKHEQLERLNRDQFAVDLQSKQRVWKQGQQMCRKIVEESRKKILVNEIHAKKLKEITWDRMDVHLSAINGLKNNYVVYNYQIRKVSALEKRKIKLILDLRKAQKRQQKKKNFKINDLDDYNNKNIVNSGFVTPLIMTQLQAKKEDNKKDDKKKKKEDEPAQAANQPQEQTQELPTQEEWQLLYSSFELYNSNSKRNQIIMMKNIITLIKKAFNKEFNKLVKFRQNQNQMINDKNKRILEICQELKRETEAIVSRDNILESNDRVLQVKNSQIPFPRYLSREEREKLQKERLKEEERLRKLAEDDSGQRALQKMMGGTLEEKKVSALEITVEKQKWMEKPVQEMSEQQKVKLKEYEQKKQKAQEQKQRIVKKLQAQLRKLKQEIDQIMQKYDEKLFESLKRKIQYDYRIQQQQLYCARLALTLLDQEEQSRRYKELEKHIAESRHKLDNMARNKSVLSSHTQEFEAAKEQKKQAIEKERLGEFQSKIKTIEKTIFEEYHTNVKKRREFQDKLLENYPAFRNLILPLDPFKDIESRNLSQYVQKHYAYFVHQVKTLQQTFDIPENTIQKLLQNRFNLRRQQHELQQKIHILSSSMSNLEQSIEDNNRRILKDSADLKTIEEFLIKCKSDLDIQIRIKQGQVEINNQKPVPDLDDGLLIAKGEIDQKNLKIKQEANQKIAVMKEIKTCKIKVTEESLNLQKKQEHIDKLSSMIKDIQMLKVKKEMQVALSKKDAKMNQNELKSLKEQIQKVRKQGQKRIALFEQKIKKILKQIQTIKKQNKQLETQKWNLQTTVKQRQKIKDMMCGDGEAGQEAAEKFSQISVNRQLFDKAKQQTEEIQLLREELSKLKAKTFANFSNVQR